MDFNLVNVTIVSDTLLFLKSEFNTIRLGIKSSGSLAPIFDNNSLPNFSPLAIKEVNFPPIPSAPPVPCFISSTIPLVFLENLSISVPYIIGDVVVANILNPVTSSSNFVSLNLPDKVFLASCAIAKDGRIRTLYGVLFISAVLRISYCCSAVCPLINFFVLNNSSIVGINLYFMLVLCYSYFLLFFQLVY